MIKKFFELDPVDAAHSLESLNQEEAVSILKTVSPELASRAFDSLEPRFASSLTLELPPKIAAKILSAMSVTRAASLLLCIQREDEREQLLEQTDPVQADQIRKLITYPEDTAGRMMTPQFFALPSRVKVQDAIKSLRSHAQKKGQLSYIYVTDEHHRLKGVLNMRDLLLADEKVAIESIMIADVFHVEAGMDREQVVQAVGHRSFLAVPVVDRVGHLVGTIRTDELLSSVQEEATEDMQKMFGAGGDEHVSSSVSFSMKKRLPWLHINLITAFAAVTVIALFQDMIAQMTVLAVFLPVVASQGGNAGAQALAVVIRGLVLREIDPKFARRIILKEGLMGLANGLFIGSAAGAVAWLWNRNVFLGVVIALAMMVNMIAAGISGAAIPIIMKSFGKDPAQSSNIILTTVTDVVGFFSFLGFALLFRPYLVP
ncbi:MAG: magnesium transporter [Omnitrophica bacterium RIFCSPLOWO2_01_FULL_50_24]|nr:MAG: magnesium transporter [Omnitrophica bacterium RIFCSPLOWO2_01_FULL_50_24]